MALGKSVLTAFRKWTFELGGPETQARLEKLTPPRNEYGVDPYGFDVDYAISAIAPMLWLYKNYFRCETHGLEKVPAEGRMLLIANHSGQLPLDAAMIGCALLADKDPPRAIRSMVEKWAPTLPFISTIFARMGQIVGTPENCRRLLAAGEAVLVFPEGVRGLNKPWEKRYQLQEFGLGFMRLALETDTPIVPVGVVGAEEQAMQIANARPIAKLLGFPAFPITPTVLPFPLPSRYRLYFGAPMHFTGSPDDEDAELDRKARQVKGAVQALINEGLRERRHIFW